MRDPDIYSNIEAAKFIAALEHIFITVSAPWEPVIDWNHDELLWTLKFKFSNYPFTFEISLTPNAWEEKGVSRVFRDDLIDKAVLAYGFKFGTLGQLGTLVGHKVFGRKKLCLFCWDAVLAERETILKLIFIILTQEITITYIKALGILTDWRVGVELPGYHYPMRGLTFPYISKEVEYVLKPVIKS